MNLWIQAEQSRQKLTTLSTGMANAVSSFLANKKNIFNTLHSLEATIST
jgi:hypothetical protein